METVDVFEEKEFANLVADLGLFHVLICDGPRQMLGPVMESLQDRITAPLKIILDDEMIGIRRVSSGVPSSFEIVIGKLGAPDIDG